jgi:two-component system, OmpR family, sensor histidine kinase TctE
MSLRRFRSLQVRLAVRLAALFVVGSATIVAILVWRAYDTAGTLGDRDLNLRAADLARYVTATPDGNAQLALPSRLREAYDAALDADIFAIRGRDGRIIAAVPPAFGSLVERWPAATDEPSYFQLSGVGGNTEDYYGLGIGLDSTAGPLSVWVAREAGGKALAHSLLQEFVLDIAWVIPLFMLVTLAIAILAIRGTLRPIQQVSEIAASIGPGTTSVRLPQDNLPSEITPLVATVNRALERLEQGFTMQRQFTANAAHELRTPLAIITGALEGLEPTIEVERLKTDVGRMNRLVEQLLSVARLDAIALDVSSAVDLNDVARDVVATLAPWALAQGRVLGFTGPDRPVPVTGNAYAIADAIRNLVENAVAHAPARSEVTIATNAEGAVSVADRGPGVSQEDRQRIFERFWRGKGAPSHGAGLGLAIVTEIMKAHDGTVRAEDGPNGGSVFTLTFRPAR